MNAKISVLTIFVEAITYLSLYNLHDYNFNQQVFIMSIKNLKTLLESIKNCSNFLMDNFVKFI